MGLAGRFILHRELVKSVRTRYRNSGQLVVVIDRGTILFVLADHLGVSLVAQLQR